MDCGIHAREWVSPAFCLHAIRMLLKDGSFGLLNKFDFNIIPVANPDGYVYTQTDRFGGKTVSQAPLESESSWAGAGDNWDLDYFGENYLDQANRSRWAVQGLYNRYFQRQSNAGIVFKLSK